jgi:hypothetical protein
MTPLFGLYPYRTLPIREMDSGLNILWFIMLATMSISFVDWAVNLCSIDSPYEEIFA